MNRFKKWIKALKLKKTEIRNLSGISCLHCKNAMMFYTGYISFRGKFICIKCGAVHVGYFVSTNRQYESKFEVINTGKDLISSLIKEHLDSEIKEK